MVAQDGRDKARRQGITQQQRAVVTYSFSWISAVVAQMPAQLYFREPTPALPTSLGLRRPKAIPCMAGHTILL